MKWKLFLFHLELWLGLYVDWIHGNGDAKTTTNDLVFYDSHGSPIETVEAKENDTFVLSCSSKVSKKLELSCDNAVPYTKFADLKSGVEITAYRLSHGKECSCYYVTNGEDMKRDIRLNITYQAEISSFQLTRGDAITSEAKSIKLKCEATGNPPPLLQLIHRNESHVERVLHYTIDHSFEFSGIAKCELAGQFTCVASNKLNIINSTRGMIIQVKCPLKLCESSKDLVYRVPLMKISQIQICVLYYIEGLYDVQIYKHVNNEVKTVHFTITFTYTTPTLLRGDFTLTLNLTSQNDYGKYFLQINDKQEKNDKLYFTLQQQETPQCPTNLSIIPEGKNFFLSWMAGDDGGLKQTFVVLKATSNKDFTEIGQINDTLGNITTFKVAGLVPNTTYIFSVNVYNHIGTTNCSHLTVSESASAYSIGKDEESMQVLQTTLIVFGVVLFVGLGVLLIYKARRRSIQTCAGSGKMKKSKLEEKETTNDLYNFNPTLPPDSNVKKSSDEENVSKLVEVEREKKALIATNNDSKTSNSTEQNVYGNMEENKPRHNSMDTSGALIQVL